MGRHFIFPFAVSALLFLAACSSTDVREPMELTRFEARATIEKLWSRDVGSGQDKRYTTLVPALGGDAIYAGDYKGRVVAFGRESGQRLWRANLNAPVSGGVGYGPGVVMFGTYDGEVIVLNAEDGAEKWRATLSSEVLAPPQTNGDVVVVETLDGRLYALDFNSGEQRWLYESSNPSLTLRGTSTPTLVGGTVYAGFANGKVIAFQAGDGLVEWEQRVAIPQGRSPLDRIVDIDGTPLLVGDLLFAAAYQGQLVALSRATGRTLWFRPESTHLNLSAGGGKVYLTDADSAVKAFSTGSGEQSWENRQLLYRDLTAPQAFGAYVAVADNEGGYLHILSQTDGALVARTKIDGSGVRAPMIADGNVLYVYANDGTLVALRVVPK